MKRISLLLPGNAPRLLLITVAVFFLITAHFLLFQSNTVQAQSRVIYVKANADPGGDGSFWDNAFQTLQDALADAGDGDEIWIAAGIYYPDEGVGQTNNDRSSTFNIPPGVSLYGGFAGYETQRDQRNWEANPTVLSGDIDGDDVTDVRGVVTDTANIVGDNAYHVVKLDGTTTPITASTRIDSLIITAGQANGEAFPDNAGGGLFCDGFRANSVCSPTLTNVVFAGNWAIVSGGMFNFAYDGGTSSPTLTNVTFTGNWASQDGGAMYNYGYLGESSPTLTNVTFSGNEAGLNGGAIYNSGYAGNGQNYPTLINATFSGNWARERGGAMYNDGRYSGVSKPVLTNVTFSGNRAELEGGAIYNFGHFDGGESSPTLTNVILWDNSAPTGAIMYNYGQGATPTIAHSLVQGGLSSSNIYNDEGASLNDGGYNIDVDPLFVTPVNPADAPTTAGDLRLQARSLAIGVGDNSVLPMEVTTDLDGNPRIVGSAVDLGAYEFQFDCATVGSRLYVHGDATGANNGSSWDNAFTSLRDALLTVDACGNVDEIWVAEGIYAPGPAPHYTFNIPPGVALYGGFAGGEDELAERDWEDNPTVLSGDIGGDDMVDGRGVVTDTVNIVDDNANHVVTLDGTTTPITASTRLDGFIITAGQAKGLFPDNIGGGLYCDGTGGMCSPTLTNVIFSGNSATGNGGGAMYNNGRDGGESSPTLTNATFAGNSAASSNHGGAMYNDGRNGGDSSPTLTNVMFAGNRAVVSGGAMYNRGSEGGTSSPTLTNVTFSGNLSGYQGGAIFNGGSGGGASSPTLTNVTFSGNSATSDGGAMANEGGDGGDSSPTLTNVTFSGNSSGYQGGAMFNGGSDGGESSPMLTNVTFAGNRAGLYGGAMFNVGNNGESSPTLTNVILWGNSAGESGDAMYNYRAGARPTIAYSLLQGGLDGGGIYNDGGSVSYGDGNIDADPLFVTPVDPADAPTTAGNLRLRPSSPAIDAGHNDDLPPGLITDLDGNPRIEGGAVDMGAYEFQFECAAIGNRLYVDGDATGAGDGTSWDDALTSLRNALLIAAACDNVDEIWVAQGVYTPGFFRSDSFHILPGVAIYGGFSASEEELEERDWDAYPTVLSGDIGRDDVTDARGVVTDTANIKNDNAYHVVMLDGTTTPITASTRLDGVIITAGHAKSNFPNNVGGGLYCDGTAGMCNPTLAHVTFSGNQAEGNGGGAMYNNGRAGGQSSPALTNVTFSGNLATNSGGALFNDAQNGGQSNPTLINVTFSGNQATLGGAMSNDGQSGGQSSPTLVNVTFAGNSAGESGGALYNNGRAGGQSSPTLTNVILWRNSAGDKGDAMYNDAATPTIAYSLVQGGLGAGGGIANDNGGNVIDGGNNIDADPLFVTPIDPADAPTTAGDLRLQPGSPAIDAGNSGALDPAVTTDLDGNPRIQGGSVDMGAYEYTLALLTVEASPSSVLEDSGQALTVTFIRTQNSVGELVVAFDVGGTATFGDDYVQSGASSFDSSGGAVTLGDGVISHTLLLTPTADFIAEPDETITLTLIPGVFYEVGTTATVTGTILDDDTAGVLVSPTSGLTTTEWGGTATFTVTLQSQPTGTVTVTLTSSDPTEGTTSPAALTFDAGNWQTAQMVTVTGVDDDEDDGDVTYTIELTVSSDDPTYDGLTAPTVTVTNLDDDDPPPAEYWAYLPLLSGPPPGLPDLVVQELAVSSDGVTVVIANVGESAVVDPFWVDVYIDPNPVPTAPNQIWQMLSEEGLAWGISDEALPLQPGQSLTLTIGDDYFAADASNFSGALTTGAVLYAQVDSAHSDTDYGAVLEAHEADHSAYNNVAGPVIVLDNVTVRTVEAGPERSFVALPPRR